jgi:pentatricopeptide repeat protein
MKLFKNELRHRLKQEDLRISEKGETEGNDRHRDNLLLGYMALLHVCGHAGRPDLALQVFYALSRDGLAPCQAAWEAYLSGKESGRSPLGFRSSRPWMSSYENVLEREARAWEPVEKDVQKIPLKRIRIRL